MENFVEIESEIIGLISVIDDYIDVETKRLIVEFATHCECVLAYEEICATIEYQNIPITLSQYEKIKKCGEVIQYDNDFIQKMKKYVKS